ncbi:hypothetical protein N798_02925 [Knoellia flava TL1]|uniref:Uncharacterized protein n=2 Tax=Knoellia flava TaxID=913969 RepID=A0A8H9KPE2_9MICO|nr:hypothetical protein [Knoellia flava]KGN35462.1 hypothetical protein N798_02925 [Knoellia flava TL1]GGB69177.1 hypothetical protein GCM10011314_05590 [Knoellia flava]
MADTGDEGVVEQAVADAARRLYAVPLADFVASRKALATEVKAAAGPAASKAVLALRKPTLPAWAMNLVPRGDSSALADLVGLGARMRAAQSRLDTATLTSVRGERDAALTAYVEAVAGAADGEGASLSAAAREEVRASAIAALADESASDALASGQLTRALSYSGFGEVDLSGAVGVTSSGSVVSVLPGGAILSGTSTEEAGEADDEEADDGDELTEEELARAVAEAKEAKARARAREKEQRRAATELAEAQAEMSAAQASLDEAEKAARAARRAVVDAQSRLDAARATVAAVDAEDG